MIGDIIKQLRKENSISQQELGKIIGITTSSIGMYETGVRQPSYVVIKKIADYFNVSTDYLLERTDNKNSLMLQNAFVSKKVIELPILGVVRAGQPLYAEQNILGYLSIDADLVPSGECFYLKVQGDSMNLSNIVDGKYVMIHKQDEVENGEIALVLVDGEAATIKKFYRNGSMVTLMPNSSNPEHQPRMVDLKTETLKVIGKVVGSIIFY